MTNRISRNILLVLAMMMVSLPAFVSCNKDDDKDDDTFTYSTSKQTTLIKLLACRPIMPYWLIWTRCISPSITITD